MTFGRDITYEEMMASSWDHVIAAARGDGWCKQMVATFGVAGVSYRIWFGSCMVADTADLREAVISYNTADILAANSESTLVDD